MSFWNDRRRDLQYLIQNDNLDGFMNWTPIKWTMNCGNAEWIENEIKLLRENKRWSSFLKDYPEHYLAQNIEKYPGTNLIGNTIHHAYHWYMFEEKTNIKLNELNSIFEFGAGFGSMSRIAYFMGFAGKYYIYDLPELEIIAKHYFDNQRIIRLNTISKIPDEYDLLVAMWSVTESNPIMVNKIIKSNYKNCLIAFSDAFDGMNNLNFFPNRQQIDWLPNNFYCIK